MGAVEGKVAFITGAARGQGRSHAVRLAAEGADIIAVDLCGPVASAAAPPATRADLDETVHRVEAAGGRIVARVADVRDHAAMEDVVAEGVDAFGTVDIVIANAGISTVDGLFTCTPDVWREVIDINLTGVFNTLVAGTKPMVAAGAGGSVVLVSSIMGLRAAGGIPAYTAAKHGVVGLMRAAAHDLAPHRIRVNAVHPGNVRTAMIDNPGMHALFRPDLAEPTLDDIAWGLSAINLLPEPWVEPEDVTEAVLWLVSDASRFVTGVTLPVDLGATVK